MNVRFLFAAVLLGGTSFSGGIGGVGGTAIGVLFLATLQNGLSVSGVADEVLVVDCGGGNTPQSCIATLTQTSPMCN